MSDPIEKLTRLGDALEGAPMLLPASEIRARGDRIRRRKHAVIAGASAAVIAAVAVPVIALTLGGSDKAGNDFTPQPSPTITDSVPSAALTAENLLTSDDAIYPNGGSDWRASATFPGDGQSAFSPCARMKLAGIGAGDVFQREFEFVVTDTNEVEPTLHLNEIVAEFSSDAEAQAAYDTVKSWYGDHCLPSGADTFGAGDFRPVETGVDGTAETQLSTYTPVDESLDPFGDEVWFLDSGFVLSGDRIAVLTQLTHGQDYNWEDGTPVEKMLPIVAERLVLGNGATEVEPTPVEDWPTSIPADFPLVSGWPEDDGSSEYQLDEPSIDNQAMIPAGELDACGNSAVDPGAIDRLTTRLTPPAESYIRELQLFPTDQEAVTFVAHLRALYGDCPTEGTTPTITTEVFPGAVGDESVVITRVGEEIYRTVINVVRIGNAVVVDLASDEGLAADVQDLATVTRENLADVIAGMTELQRGPGGAGTDLSAPAGTTTIPDDFPLDLALGEPPVADGETTVEGPGPDVEGARALTMCGTELAFPNGDNPDPEHQSGYSVSTIEGYDGRTIHAYPTVQDALDQMDLLRSQIQGCDRDNGGDGLSDRLFESFNSNTGYDSVTVGWTYEVKEGVGAPAGELHTVVRVGNAILAIVWSGEYSAAYQRDAAPNQVELAKLIGDEMRCDFSVEGC